jgi:hypothetical protein
VRELTDLVASQAETIGRLNLRDLLARVDNQDRLEAWLQETRDVQAFWIADLLAMFPPQPVNPNVVRYRPRPSPQLTTYSDDEYDEFVRQLTEWVNEVFRPLFRPASDILEFTPGVTSCWARHPLCLLALDRFKEEYSRLYIKPSRDRADLQDQGELFARHLESLIGWVGVDTRECRAQRRHVETEDQAPGAAA